jgi:regulator of protease activity HflC (stomatin/prohibitin superfamily)
VRIINYADKIDRASTAGDGIVLKPAITVLDKRGLPVSIELTVQYRLNAQLAAQTISNWGFSWEDKIIDPVARDVVRNVVGQYDAETLPIMRNARSLAKSKRVSAVALIAKKTALPILNRFNCVKLVLPQKVKEQIERVQVAKQEVEKAQQDVERAKQEALKKETEAQGTANALTIEAASSSQSQSDRSQLSHSGAPQTGTNQSTRQI